MKRMTNAALLTALFALAALAIASYHSGAGAAAHDAHGGDADVTITLVSVGSSAWEVASVDGADGVADTGMENATITLQEGIRYRFVNEGGSAHPLDFRDADGTILLAQGSHEGTFEGDADVAFEADDEGVTFTLTPELASAIARYYCTVHPRMTGSIAVE